MPTFDIVNKLDLQQIDNAINSANRTIDNRYDFRGLDITVELNKKEKTVKVVVPDEMRLKAVREIVNGSMMDQKVSPKVVDWGDKEDASLGAIRISCKLREGIDKEIAKKIVKKIKDSKLKVKASIQGESVRVEGKKIDDLQEIIAMLKEEDYDVPLQFDNMKK